MRLAHTLKKQKFLNALCLDLRMDHGLNTEVVMLLKLIFHDVVTAVNLCDYILIHNLITRQLQKVKSADCIVVIVFAGFKPLFLSVQ